MGVWMMTLTNARQLTGKTSEMQISVFTVVIARKWGRRVRENTGR